MLTYALAFINDCPFATLRLHNFVVVFLYMAHGLPCNFPDLHDLLVDLARALRSGPKVKCRSDARFVDSQWSGLWPESFRCFVFGN